MPALDQRLVGLLQAGGRALDRVAADPAGLLEDLGAAAQLRERDAGLDRRGADPGVGEVRLEPDQVVGGEAAEDGVARLALDPELGQQLR